MVPIDGRQRGVMTEGNTVGHEALEDMPIKIVMGALTQETTLGVMFEENPFLFEDYGPEIIEALSLHGEYRGGGGAAGEYTLTRLPA